MKRKRIRKPKHCPTRAAIPCPACGATLFYLYADSICKHIGFICPVCGHDGDVSVSVHLQEETPWK